MDNTTLPDLEVREQLNKILADDLFSNSPILQDFLSFVVRETLAGNSMILKEYTIGTKVLSKNTSYNPQSDASVRIHAGRLRKSLQAYYSGKGKNDPVLISIPTGSYVPLFEYNIPSKIRSAAAGHKIYSKPTLAVLPFHVYNEAKDASLADGLCDQLCTDFTNLKDIAVISYYSARRIADQYDDLRKLGQLLNVDYLLTGNIQSEKNDIRIRVQLTVANSLQQIWAGTYERKRQAFDTFTLQDDIVKHVINRIAGSLGIIIQNEVKIPADQKLQDVKVYDAVFWYYYLVREIDEEIYCRALESMKESVKLDPNYAMGWAILSETYVAGHFYRFNCLEGENPLDEALQSGKTALKLDRHCYHAYQSLALAHVFRHEKQACLAIARDWLALNANIASISGAIGFCLICCGEYEKGYRMIMDSIDLNPYYPWWFNAGISMYHLKNGDYDEAIYWAEKLHDYTPAWELLLQTTAYAEAGNTQEADEHRARLQRILPTELREATVHAFIHDASLTELILTRCYEQVNG